MPHNASTATATQPAAVTVRLALPVPAWDRRSTVAVTAKKGNNKTKAPNKADLPSKV
jgi:hypothetical protein